jgi:hypothetical protein
MRCLRLEDSGSRVCYLLLGLADDWVQLTIRLKDVVGQLHVMHDEH